MRITTTPGSDNISTFEAYGPGGELYVLDSVSRVEVGICSERAAISGGKLLITSADGTDVAFAGTQLSIRFGSLSPYRGTYYPQIVAFDALNPDGVVLAGKGYATEIELQVDC